MFTPAEVIPLKSIPNLLPHAPLLGDIGSHCKHFGRHSFSLLSELEIVIQQQSYRYLPSPIKFSEVDFQTDMYRIVLFILVWLCVTFLLLCYQAKAYEFKYINWDCLLNKEYNQES